MKKELYQMLEMIVKSAYGIQQRVNVRANPNNPESGRIIEATDSKRAIQIEMDDYNLRPGQYKIAKTGKEYEFLAIPASERSRFPDTDRVMYKPEAATFSRSLGNENHDIIMAKIIAFFGVMQEEQNPGSTKFNINTLHPNYFDVLKPWMKLGVTTPITMMATTKSYPVQLNSEFDDLKIRYILMPYGGN